MTGFGILVFFANLNLMEFQVRYLALFPLFLSNRWLRVVLDWKYSQEYPDNPGVPQGSILGPMLVVLCFHGLPDYIICNTAVCADDTTLSSKCDEVSDLWQQLELASELQSDILSVLETWKTWNYHWIQISIMGNLENQEIRNFVKIYIFLMPFWDFI